MFHGNNLLSEMELDDRSRNIAGFLRVKFMFLPPTVGETAGSMYCVSCFTVTSGPWFMSFFV